MIENFHSFPERADGSCVLPLKSDCSRFLQHVLPTDRYDFKVGLIALAWLRSLTVRTQDKPP